MVTMAERASVALATPAHLLNGGQNPDILHTVTDPAPANHYVRDDRILGIGAVRRLRRDVWTLWCPVV